jgi:hypothetical protein
VTFAMSFSPLAFPIPQVHPHCLMAYK